MGDATAEAAFAVEKDHQHHGFGSILMDRIVAAARNRGIGQVHMICARDNSRMQHLAEKFGARINSDHGEMLGKIAPERNDTAVASRRGHARHHRLRHSRLRLAARLRRLNALQSLIAMPGTQA